MNVDEADSMPPPSVVGLDTLPRDEVAEQAGAGDCMPTEALVAPQLSRYRILGPLGRGGMGVVWRAIQLCTKREVALKIPAPGLFSSPSARKRFEREIELTARLDHPSIARVFDSGVDQGIYFYAMELVEGLPLDEYVRQSKLDARQVLGLMRQVCRAMQHANERGVMHRDLKPGNILVDVHGNPKVVDFGLGAALASDVGEWASVDGLNVIGTAAYMSPEQAAGLVVDIRTDVFSLGVILYRLLLKRPPMDLSGTQVEVFRRICECEVAPPRRIDRRLDGELQSLLMKALARDPKERYASAGEMAQDISNYLNGDPLTARPATTVYFLKKRLKRYRGRVAIAGVAVAVLAGVSTYSAIRVVDESAQNKQNASGRRWTSCPSLPSQSGDGGARPTCAAGW